MSPSLRSPCLLISLSLFATCLTCDLSKLPEISTSAPGHLCSPSPVQSCPPVLCHLLPSSPLSHHSDLFLQFFFSFFPFFCWIQFLFLKTWSAYIAILMIATRCCQNSGNILFFHFNRKGNWDTEWVPKFSKLIKESKTGPSHRNLLAGLGSVPLGRKLVL